MIGKCGDKNETNYIAKCIYLKNKIMNLFKSVILSEYWVMGALNTAIRCWRSLMGLDSNIPEDKVVTFKAARCG